MRENNEYLLAVDWWVILNSLDLFTYFFSKSSCCVFNTSYYQFIDTLLVFLCDQYNSSVILYRIRNMENVHVTYIMLTTIIQWYICIVISLKKYTVFK